MQPQNTFLTPPPSTETILNYNIELFIPFRAENFQANPVAIQNLTNDENNISQEKKKRRKEEKKKMIKNKSSTRNTIATNNNRSSQRNKNDRINMQFRSRR